ncbi:hypothetical protein EIN_487240 [Entamoeba invadens IP1]|uniref:Uncharacterized protein n=1 Tax=Entamoeba invadens IP1 TaxID=370355 RepID=A0A0A1U4R1_ENTIV|nr:hypothetical protein EIN_487240 [Entamoeba invadens IP1]ELP89242.1 hypothetical protein EIN_487240 [Entamoeba invadens IP1]|eukprot:XP_004256013.1 hypothetical protein EIN_487240 [Entamoeba invadens IP1]
MTQQDEIITLLSQIISLVGGPTPQLTSLTKFYSNLSGSYDDMLNLLLEVPLQNLVCDTTPTLSLLLSPIFHFLLPFLTSQNEVPDLPKSIPVLSFLHRTDHTISPPQIVPSQRSKILEDVISLVNPTKRIEITADSLEDANEQISISALRQASKPYACHFLFYEHSENTGGLVNFEGVFESTPIKYDFPLKNRETVDFLAAITSGLSSCQTVNLGKIDLDSGTLGNFLGKCICNGFDSSDRTFLYKTLSLQNPRVDEAVLLGIIKRDSFSKSSETEQLIKIILNPSVQNPPDLSTQFLALIAYAFVYQNCPNKERDTYCLSKAFTRYPRGTQSTAGIFCGLVALGIFHFGGGFDVDQVEAMKRIMNGARYGKPLNIINCTEGTTSTFGWELESAENIENFQDVRFDNRRIPTLITVPAVCLSLGLGYFDTDNFDIAQIVELPRGLRDICAIRPDDIFARILCKNLIFFDKIEKSEAWIFANIPEELSHRKFSAFEMVNAKYFIIASACYVLALKYAGSFDSVLKSVFLKFIKKIQDSLFAAIRSANQNFTLNTPHFDRSLKIMCLSIALLFAGSCDKEIYEVFKRIYSVCDEYITFGSHAVMSTSIGLLFCGFGEFSLDSKSYNIPKLVLGFYPLFEPDISNEVIYPNLLKQVGLLCLEKRYFRCYNYSTKQYDTADVELVLSEQGQDEYKTETMKWSLPSLLPKLEFISKIKTTHNFLFNQLDIKENGGKVLCVKNSIFAKDVDMEDFEDELGSEDQDVLIVRKMASAVEKSSEWMMSKVRETQRNALETSILKLLVAGFKMFGDERMRLIAESVNLLL